MNQKRGLALVFSLICLFFGLLIYANLRGENLILHSIMKNLGLFEILQIPASWLDSYDFPDWLIFALPDGLWMLSLVLVIGAIWHFKWNKTAIFWYSTALSFGLLYELFQNTQFVPGTFNWTDMVFIFIGGIVPIFFFWKQNRA